MGPSNYDLRRKGSGVAAILRVLRLLITLAEKRTNEGMENQRWKALLTLDNQ